MVYNAFLTKLQAIATFELILSGCLLYLKEYSIQEIPGYGIYCFSLDLKSVNTGPKSNKMLVFTVEYSLVVKKRAKIPE